MKSIIFLFCTISFALAPLNGEAQDAEIIIDTDMTLTIKQAFRLINKQTDYKFVYRHDLIKIAPDIDLKKGVIKAGELLDKCLSPISFTYNFTDGGTIVVKRKPTEFSDSGPIEFLNVQFQVSGIVTDNAGTPIPGVSVLIKGTSTGVAADFDGNYSIMVEDPESILVFSSIGFISQEIQVSGDNNINITLIEDTQTLDEVVILGYASQGKSDLTGAVSKLDSEDIENIPATSVAETLQGKVTGVQVVTASGQPGATSDIVIRGGGSVNGMPPLFVVDGVRMGTGYTFNNNDIESIEILKDASSAAIYGAQAAGGVVLIQTKRGSGAKHRDKVSINVNGYYGIRETLPLTPLMDTQQYFAARQAFGYNIDSWGDPATLPNTDWNDVLFSTGQDQNYTASLTGSSEKANFYVSGNYFRQDGVALDNSFERYSLRINSDYKLGDKVRFGETVYLYKSNLNPTTQPLLIFRSVPSMPVYDENGDFSKTPAAGYFNGGNPAQQALERRGNTLQNAMEGSVYLDVEVLKDLHFRSTFGATIGSTNYSQFIQAYDTGAVTGNATLTNTSTDYENLTANFTLNYDKTFGKHNLRLLAGYEVYKEDRRVLGGNATNFAVDITQSYSLNTDLSSQRVNGGIYYDSRLLSQFGRINYEYDDKYLMSATVRRDGSDRFGPENKWGVFPAFSAGWRISNESFFEDLKNTVSTLKLRASYGSLGNYGSIPQYLYEPSFGPQNITSLADGTRVQAYGLNPVLPNRNIKWEEVKTTDIGADVAFLNNSLSLTLDYYSRITGDMIYAVPVPLTAGFYGNPVFTNIGDLSNKGFEVGINYRESLGKFVMDLGFTGSYNKNEVISLTGTGNQAINNGYGGAYLSNQISRTEAGQPISQFFGYVVEGIYKTDEEVAARGVIQNGAGAGDLIYRDVDNNGTITAEDRDFIGNPWPDFTYGVNLKFDYKGVDLSANFQGVAGMDIYNANKHYSDYLAGDYNASPTVFDASFFDGNGLTSAPRLGYTNSSGAYIRDPNANYTKVSSYFVEKGDYLKLRNIALGYNFNKDFLSKIQLAAARVYIMANNVFTITEYSGKDPEVLGEGITARGIDGNAVYPQTRFVAIGLNLDF
ncbi:SusC/RagA family TonB-linked outer membrane protein [Arenibacter algicola]|nr:TonB-dependent receptor [Arenibacter algicola]